MPQGLGPLLFNLFINYIFYLFNDTDIYNYADDNTIHTCDFSLDALMAKIERAASEAIECFDYNDMKLNPDKCHLLVSGHKYEIMIGNISDVLVIESSNVRLLRMMIDSS